MISAGAIVFRKIKKEIKYLLLKHIKNGTHWGFPKGRIEEREEIKETALREVREETGLKIKKLIGEFKWEENYSFINKEGIKIKKKVIYFLAEIEEEKTRLSKEHSKIGWFSFNEALKKLEEPSLKNLLKKVDDLINSK